MLKHAVQVLRLDGKLDAVPGTPGTIGHSGPNEKRGLFTDR